MTETTKITPSDIESKIRDIQGQVDTVAEDSKKKVAIGGSVVAMLLLFIIYTMGKKSGQKKSTVLEIRRL
ncbi:MAG: hypothetical protein ACRBI6_04890 [Acidimicrobiales bacterium]